MNDVAEQYVAAGRVAVAVLGEARVSSRWNETSALPLYLVSGLAGHLAGQVGVVLKVLEGAGAAEVEGSVVSGADFIVQGRWIDAPPDSEVHEHIRRSGDQYAQHGPADLVTLARRQLSIIERELSGRRLDEPVKFPWDSPHLSLEDLLINRMMEIVVHVDDLCASVDIPVPEFPTEIGESVLNLLLAVALRREGAHRLIQSLTRPDRLTVPLTAF